jgi:hypothetical protein
MFPPSTDEYRQDACEGWTSSTPFDRCLRSLSRVTNGRSDEKAEHALGEYVATLHDDARGAALDKMVRRRQTGRCLVVSDISYHQLH